MDNLTDLQKSIGAAFSRVQYPGDNQITFDEYGGEGLGDPDCRDVKAAFMRKTWQGILPVLQDHHFQDSSFCLSREAVPYYLPAYLIECLKYYNVDNLLFDSLLSNLTPTRHNPLFYYMISLLTEEQEEVIGDFLKYMQGEAQSHQDEYTEKEIRDALNEYWGLPPQKRKEKRAKLRGSILFEITRIVKSMNDLSIFLKITNLNSQKVSVFLSSIQGCLGKLTIYERQTGRWSFKKDPSLAGIANQLEVLDIDNHSDIKYTVMLVSANFFSMSANNPLDIEIIKGGRDWGYNLQGEIHFLKGNTTEIHTEKIYSFNKVPIGYD